jgi:hypothetical protein
LADFGLNENKFVQSNCISYQLKDLISNISTEIQSKTSKFDENQFDTNLDSQNEISFEALEAKLIIKAKMEFEKVNVPEMQITTPQKAVADVLPLSLENNSPHENFFLTLSINNSYF